MLDPISRALAWILDVLLPAHRPEGRHSARYLGARPTAPIDPVTASPWSRPWTGPTKDEAQAIFRQRAEAALRLRSLQQQRRRALYYATWGIDFPYSYEGAPFGSDAFETARGTA